MPITNTAYVRDQTRCFGPVLFPGEVYAFYINFTDPVNDPGFDNFRLDIMNDKTGARVAQGIGILEKDEGENGFYNILCSYQCPNLPFGWYRLVIWDTAENSVKAVSNTLQLEERAAVKNTAFVVWRNNENIYNYRYEENPFFYNKIRLPLIQLGMVRPQLDRDQYRNVSDKRLRNLRGYKDLVVKLESYYFDEFGHLAISDVYEHDTIFVDNHFIVPKEAYQIDENVRSMLNKGSIECYVLDVEPPAEAAALPEYLVDNTIDEILAEGDYIIVNM